MSLQTYIRLKAVPFFLLLSIGGTIGELPARAGDFSCSEERDLLGGYALAFPWLFDHERGLDQIIMHTEDPDTTSFRGAILDDDPAQALHKFKQQNFGGGDLHQGPGITIQSAGTLTPLTASVLDDFFSNVERSNRIGLDRKRSAEKNGRTLGIPYVVDANFFVLRAAAEKLPHAHDLIRQTYFDRSSETTDVFDVDATCRIVRSRTEFEIDSTFVLIDVEAPPAQYQPCFATGLLIHYGFGKQQAVWPYFRERYDSSDSRFAVNGTDVDLGVGTIYGVVPGSQPFHAGMVRCDAAQQLRDRQRQHARHWKDSLHPLERLRTSPSSATK